MAGEGRRYPIDKKYSAIAIAYKNEELIAESVLPMTPVPSKEFKWIRHTREEGYQLVDDRVGRKSKPNQVSFEGTEETSSCVDYGLDDPIPNSDLEANNIPGFDIKGKSTEYLKNLLMLRHEKRVADTVFNAATYPADNREVLAGGDQLDNDATDAKAYLLDVIDRPLMRPNIAVFGNDSWRKIRQNPSIVEAVKGTGAGVDARGIITRQQFADLMELQAVYVGRGRANLSKRGQNADIRRLWGNHIAFLHRDTLAGPQRGMTFGMTAKFGTDTVRMIEDPDVGIDGGIRNRQGWKGRIIITAADLGFFVENAVSDT